MKVDKNTRQLTNEKYDGSKKITRGNKTYTTDEYGNLIDTESREKYRRKEYKGSDGKTYHFQDGKLVNKDNPKEELGENVTVYDDNGIGYQFAGTEDGAAQYKVADIKPPTDVDKSEGAVYTSGGKKYSFKDNKLVGEDGKELEEGAMVEATIGEHAGCKYKMGKDGLELYKSNNFRTKDGRNLAFYADGKGGFKLVDTKEIDDLSQEKRNLLADLEGAKNNKDLSEEDRNSKVTELEGKLKEKETEINNAELNAKEIDAGELEIIGKNPEYAAKFTYRQGSGTLSALKQILDDDTAGFTYKDRSGVHNLKVREDGLLETVEENGINPRIMKTEGPRKSTFRNDGSGVFINTETKEVATADQVNSARSNNQVKSWNELRIDQARIANDTQAGNVSSILGADMDSYTQGAFLNARNKAISQMNSTIGEGQALIVSHANNIDTATAVETAAQSAGKQFEGVMGANINARERKANFTLTNADREDIANIAFGENAKIGLEAIRDSDTQSQARRTLAQEMLEHGIYKGGGHIQVDANGKSAIEAFVNTFGGRTNAPSLTVGQTAAIERLTANERAEVRTVLNGTYSDQQAFLNNPNVSDGQKLYMQQILNGDGIVEARNDPGILNAHMSLATTGQNIVSAGILGKTQLQAQQAVNVGAIKAKNQFNQEIAVNAVGEVEADTDVLARQAQNEFNLKSAKNDIKITPNISLDYAKTLEKQRFDISQEKMYDEAFKLRAKGELLYELRNPPASIAKDDLPNWTRSLLKTIMSKGGDDDIMQFAFHRTRMKTTDEGYNADLERVYDEFYAASEEPTMKAFGKFISDCKNLGVDPDSLPSFKQWCEGAYSLIRSNGTTYTYDGSKYKSLQDYVTALGEESLATASKGYIKFATSNPELRDKYSKKAIMLGMIRNKSDEAQAELRRTIADWEESDRLKAMCELSDVDIARMTETGWNTIFGDIRKKHLTQFQTLNPKLYNKLTSIKIKNERLWSGIESAMQDFIES